MASRLSRFLKKVGRELDPTVKGSVGQVGLINPFAGAGYAAFKGGRALYGEASDAFSGSGAEKFFDKAGNFLSGRGFVQDKERRERWAEEERQKQEAMTLLAAAPDATSAAVRAAAAGTRRKAGQGFGRRAAFLRQAAGMPPLGGAATLLGGL